MIGWHFYREGADKIGTDWTSAGFFRIAKGPLTPVFLLFLWDGQGQARLDEEATLEAWDQYRQRVVDHYRFDEKQIAEAQQVFDTRKGQLEWFFITNHDDLQEFRNNLERIDKYKRDAARSQVASLRGQIHEIEQKTYGKLASWLSTIDAMWAGYEHDLNAVANEEQSRRGHLALPAPGRHLLDTKFIDSVIPYFDVIVGACLILGLGTRLAALAGAGFLASIIATQWPGAEGAVPTYDLQIEMVGMLVLAAVGAGRFAGLDYFVYLLWRRCCPSNQKKQENKS